MKRMRIGIFGGTFDPIHIGHVALASAAAKEFRLNHVYFVPAYIPPHKNRPMTPAHHRLAMLRKVCRADKRFTLSDYELRKRGISYTVRTLKYFARTFPGSDLFVIIGQDNAAEFHTWKEPEQILELASLIILRRGRGAIRRALSNRALANSSKKIRILQAPRFDVSSSEIRERLSVGKPVSSLIPEAVEHYIRQHRLYGTDAHKGRNK